MANLTFKRGLTTCTDRRKGRTKNPARNCELKGPKTLHGTKQYTNIKNTIIKINDIGTRQFKIEECYDGL